MAMLEAGGLLIEFVGVPGSGKTYISFLLEEYLTKAGFKVFHGHELNKRISRTGKLKKIISLTPYLFKPSAIALAIKILFRKSPMHSRVILLKIYLHTLLVYKHIHFHPGIYILDEGFLHFSISFFRQNNEVPDETNLQRYLGALNKIIAYKDIRVLYLFIESTPEENYNRIENRERGWPGRIGQQTVEGKRKYLYENFKCYDELKKCHLSAEKVLVDNRGGTQDFSDIFRAVSIAISKALPETVEEDV